MHSGRWACKTELRGRNQLGPPGLDLGEQRIAHDAHGIHSERIPPHRKRKGHAEVDEVRQHGNEVRFTVGHERVQEADPRTVPSRLKLCERVRRTEPHMHVAEHGREIQFANGE